MVWRGLTSSVLNPFAPAPAKPPPVRISITVSSPRRPMIAFRLDTACGVPTVACAWISVRDSVCLRGKERLRHIR